MLHFRAGDESLLLRLVEHPDLRVTVRVDGTDLLLRYSGELPGDFLAEVRSQKPELLALLRESVSCRGCGVAIPTGHALCSDCDRQGLTLAQHAVEMMRVTEIDTLRGKALVALDRRRYPRLVLRDDFSAWPGLIAWCPVLREGDAATLKQIIKLAERARSLQDDE